MPGSGPQCTFAPHPETRRCERNFFGKRSSSSRSTPFDTARKASVSRVQKAAFAKTGGKIYDLSELALPTDGRFF